MELSVSTAADIMQKAATDHSTFRRTAFYKKEDKYTGLLFVLKEVLIKGLSIHCLSRVVGLLKIVLKRLLFFVLYVYICYRFPKCQ